MPLTVHQFPCLSDNYGFLVRDEATMRRWLTRPGRYADKDRYAYLAPEPPDHIKKLDFV